VDLYLLSQKNTVYTNKKLINLTEFIQNLRRVRKQGYGFSDEEIAKGGESVGGTRARFEG